VVEDWAAARKGRRVVRRVALRGCVSLNLGFEIRV